MQHETLRGQLIRSARGNSFTRRVDQDGTRFRRLGRGAYVRGDEWDELFSEARLRTLLTAVHLRSGSRELSVDSHCTAAAWHGLPLYKVPSSPIDVIVSGRHPRRSGRDIRRHFCPLPEEDVVEIRGVRVTSLARTVYDVIRVVSLEAAVAVFDAALRAAAWSDETRSYDEAAAERLREAVAARIRMHPGARGIRQARFVTEFADGRAQLPGESIVRLWMHQLGLPAPVLQLRVDFPDGGYAQLDFCWPQLRRWMEFDGVFKYVDRELLAGRSPDEVLADQSRRERRVRAATGWECDRCGFAQAGTIADFADFLRGIGMYPFRG
jgi:hypothetical protein